eukprot:CAMPEP_0195127346 /NCGR_PEP_ID=MMETSP0448-20130528/136795_1 /TAXON_ID=66468 /ORGANISM="Heterocapsa triquestra, Strain CCMP 448" /LENGTH=226 /DNA_ID=CAMNT_0040165081 /DNA_START=1 /DNA_END=677 /DNA_ORIENTATION=-
MFPEDSVSRVLRAALADSPWRTAAGQLCFNGTVLDPRASLESSGVGDGSVLYLLRMACVWHRERCGELAEVSQDGLTARRRGHFSKAVVMAAVPTRAFRIEILETDMSWSGGVELGFCAIPPSELPPVLPPELASLPKSWASGNDACLTVNMGVPSRVGSCTWREGVNANENLRAGDILTCTVEDGSLRIQVNDVVVADWPAGIPEDIEVYPVAGLYGTTQAVQLL